MGAQLTCGHLHPQNQKHQRTRQLKRSHRNFHGLQQELTKNNEEKQNPECSAQRINGDLAGLPELKTCSDGHEQWHGSDRIQDHQEGDEFVQPMTLKLWHRGLKIFGDIIEMRSAYRLRWT